VQRKKEFAEYYEPDPYAAYDLKKPREEKCRVGLAYFAK
jgi:hypothetical protein